MLVKDPEAGNDRERSLELEGEVSTLSVDLQQVRAQNEMNKDLLKGVNSAFPLQKTVFHQCSSSYAEKREKLVGDNDAIDAKFRPYRTDMGTKPGR